MAHRIYIYNIDSSSGESYPYYLGEWNYELPDLLLPLFGAGTKAKGKQLYANREKGITFLRKFYNVLADEYHLKDDEAYSGPVNQMFDMLENLPYDTFLIDGSDVFNMNEEKHSVQAKEWVIQIHEKLNLYESAIQSKTLEPLNELVRSSGYQNFLEALKTDWIKYGLGYWNEDTYQLDDAEIFEKNDLSGLKDVKGNIIVPAIYNEIFEFEDGIAVIRKDNKLGYINAKGNELVPPIYDDAYDAFDIYYGKIIDYDFEFRQKAGIISVSGKFGLVNIEDHQLLIPAVYDDLELIYGDYFNARTNDQYQLINHKNEQVIKEESDTPFEREGIELFFIKTQGTSKRKYFNTEGIYIGNYREDVLQVLPGNFFYVKPNKGLTKIEIIQPDGQLLDTEIDQIITLSEYRTFAYLKSKQWFVFDPFKNTYLISGIDIQKINIDYLANFFKDIYIVYNTAGNGIFDAFNNTWLLPLNPEYLKIEHLEKQFLSICLKDGMRYWEGTINELSPLYQHISNAIDYEHDELFLYQDDHLFCLNKNGEIRRVVHEEMGKLYNQKYHLRGKDLTYFCNYYASWKSKTGTGYFKYFDDESLYQMGLDLLKENKTDEAIQIFTLGAERNHPQMLSELAMIYTDPEDKLHFNLSLGLELYKKASGLGDKNAWNNLGYHYQNGIGCERNIDQAIEAYTKAGELKNGLGWANLGDLYYYGEWVEKDEDKALQYYLKAEKLYYFNSDKLASIYFSKEEYKKVLSLIKKDYDEEFSPIYYGIMYENGWGGLKINLKKSIAYYEKSLQISIYPYAVQQLLYHYRPVSEFADEVQFKKWLAYAEENEIDLDLELLGLSDKDIKGSFFSNLFRKKK